MLALSILDILTFDDIANACGETNLEHGFDFYQAGAVQNIDVQERTRGFVIVAQVKDTIVSYGQQIYLMRSRRGTDIVARCGCSGKYNCKHVAAVLVACLEEADIDALGITDMEPPSRETQQLDRWMNSLIHAQHLQQSMATPTQRPEIPRYVLREGRYGTAWEVWLWIARPRADGRGFCKPTQPDARKILALANQCEAEHMTILGLLGLSQVAYHSYGPAPLTLDTPDSAKTLAAMLATGSLCWQEPTATPLRPGPAREVETYWQEEGDRLRLQIQLGDPASQLVPTNPPFWMNPESGELGELRTGGLSGEFLAKVRSAPAIPKTLARQATEQMLERVPDIPLPLPMPEAVEFRDGIVPQPLLYLWGPKNPPTNARQPLGAYRASLAFDYDGHRILWAQETLSIAVKDDQKLLRIQCDKTAETAAMEQLLSIGLTPDQNPEAESGSFRLTPAPAHELARHWAQILESEVPRLEQAGWRVEREDSFQLRIARPSEVVAEVNDHGAWFELGLSVTLDDRQLDLAPVLAQLIEQVDQPEQLDDDARLLVELEDEGWLQLTGQQARPLLRVLFDLFADRRADDTGPLTLSRPEALRLDDLEGSVVWRGGEAVRALGERLGRGLTIEEIPAPPGLVAELRPYQRIGLGWLQLLRELGLGGVLADDMGLGKTLQVIAHLQAEKAAGRLEEPALVIAPTSLMGNWRQEAARFAPELRTLVLHGADRQQHFGALGEQDLVLTTYPLLTRDEEALSAQQWHSVILDEAQAVKNPRTKAARIVRTLPARHRLCMTGTPMENHLGELWAMFDFLLPGYLGDSRRFRRLFRTPIEDQRDTERQAALQRRIAPFLLRRTKQEVASELPDKVEIVRSVSLGDAQATAYETVRAAMDKKVRDSIASKGLARSHLTILEALLKLRQICCDPRLLPSATGRRKVGSAKLELLLDMLPGLLAEGRRILLFSQFTSMFELIEPELAKLQIPYTKLTGQTRKREAAIEQFQSGAVPLFLISLKAGGVGLNLTQADTVIHYDPWWNPAVENQATDRAHRIGQTQKVFVYKLIAEQTVEEKILALQARKAALAAGLYREAGADGEDLGFSTEDLADLLKPLD